GDGAEQGRGGGAQGVAAGRGVGRVGGRGGGGGALDGAGRHRAARRRGGRRGGGRVGRGRAGCGVFGRRGAAVGLSAGRQHQGHRDRQPESGVGVHVASPAVDTVDHRPADVLPALIPVNAR